MSFKRTLCFLHLGKLREYYVIGYAESVEALALHDRHGIHFCSQLVHGLLLHLGIFNLAHLSSWLCRAYLITLPLNISK